MKTLLTLFNLSELERKCDIPRGTLSYWLNDTRELGDVHSGALKAFFSDFKIELLYDGELVNRRELCRQAKISRSRFQRGLEHEKAEKFLRKKLAHYLGPNVTGAD